jgi:hypothetical protein
MCEREENERREKKRKRSRRAVVERLSIRRAKSLRSEKPECEIDLDSGLFHKLSGFCLAFHLNEAFTNTIKIAEKTNEKSRGGGGATARAKPFKRISGPMVGATGVDSWFSSCSSLC